MATRIAGMNRIAILPAVLALAAPAAASAGVHTAKFDVSVSGSQVTEWSERTHMIGGDCKGRSFERGAGHETVTFRSRHSERYMALGTGRLATLSPTGRYGRFGIYSPGKTERAGVYVYSKDSNGACATPETSYIPDYDCDTLKRAFNVTFAYDGKRLGVLAGSGTGGRAFEPFGSCPIQNSPDVIADGITDITSRLPARELFDGDLGKHIVLGEKTFEPSHQTAFSPSRATVRRKVTLRPVPWHPRCSASH